LGCGERCISGGWDANGNDGAQVAISLVALNARRLRSWAMGGGGDRRLLRGLYNNLQNVHVSTAALDLTKRGYSSAACVALSLVILLGGRLPDKQPVVGMTGDIDLRGRVLGVGGIREKLEVMHRRKLSNSVFVMPKRTHQELVSSGEMEEWPETLRDYGSKVIRTASNLAELMAVTMPGETLGPRGDNDTG
jgi:ATP-dependent Lon protease